MTVTSLPPRLGPVPTPFDALLKMKPQSAGLSCQNSAGRGAGTQSPGSGGWGGGTGVSGAGLGLGTPWGHLSWEMGMGTGTSTIIFTPGWWFWPAGNEHRRNLEGAGVGLVSPRDKEPVPGVGTRADLLRAGNEGERWNLQGAPGGVGVTLEPTKTCPGTGDRNRDQAHHIHSRLIS